MLRLDGKVALVTGCGTKAGGWGNGKAIAVLLARQGAKVYGCDLDLEAAQVTRDIIQDEGGTAEVQVADVTRAADVKALVQAALRASAESTSWSTTSAARNPATR